MKPIQRWAVLKGISLICLTLCEGYADHLYVVELLRDLEVKFLYTTLVFYGMSMCTCVARRSHSSFKNYTSAGFLRKQLELWIWDMVMKTVSQIFLKLMYYSFCIRQFVRNTLYNMFNGWQIEKYFWCFCLQNVP